MNITEYAINKKLFGGGGGKREGTAVPYGQPVDFIFFNLRNTREETNAILSQLTFVQTPLLPYPIYAVYAQTDNGNTGIFVIVVKDEDSYFIHTICDIANAIGTVVFSGDANYSSMYEGWALATTSLPVNDASHMVAGGAFMPVEGLPITDFNGLPIGTENEKIKNVLSVTPF